MSEPPVLPPIIPAAEWLRSSRRARGLSQRELAEVSGVSRTAVERIEAGSDGPRYDTVARLLAATGFVLLAVDRHGRALRARDPSEQLYDAAGRRFPAHLHAHRTPSYWADTMSNPDVRSWWGWHHIAWYDFGPQVPLFMYWKRRSTLPRFTGTSGDYPNGEHGRVWDDAT